MQQFIVAAFLGLTLTQNPALDSLSPKERQAAVEKMAVLGNRDAIPTLAEALKKEPKSEMRASMVAALGRIRTPEIVPVLAQTLATDLDKDVRLQAIDSMLRLYIPIVEPAGQMRTILNRAKSLFFAKERPTVGAEVKVDLAAQEALATAMQKDFDDEVRIEAARALGSLKAKEQIPVMIASLEDPLQREHKGARLEIVRSMGMIRDPAAGPALEKALRDEDKQIVGEAITSLGLVGHTGARDLLENMFRTERDRNIRNRSLEALALLRDLATAPLFESLLTHPDDYYRELSAEGLARLEYDASRFAKPFEGERKQNVRNALAFALASSGHVDYINHLANALDSRFAYQAEVYLFELGKYEGLMNELYRYLRSPNPKVRGGMARVIGNIGDPAATEQIRPLSNDPNIEVVREAVAALRKLAR